MADKKRKRHSEHDHHAEEHKRPVLEKPSDTVKVILKDQEKLWTPIIASQPGLSLSKLGDFNTYKEDSVEKPKLFLHSDAHETLNVTATEEPFKEDLGPLAHYVGIYDARRQRLKLVPARYMTIHSNVKPAYKKWRDAAEAEKEKQESQESQKSQESKTSKKSSRIDLGLEFGSKKTQKVIRERLSNNITSGKPLAEDPVALALLESLPQDTVNEEELRAAIDAERPIPRPNYEASRPADVYTISALVDGDDKLAKIPVKDWIDTLQSGRDVPLCSRYISDRIIATCLNDPDIKQVRLLRYLYLLILFYRSLQPPKTKNSSTRVPRYDFSSSSQHSQQYQQPNHHFITAITEAFPRDILLNIIARFSTRNELTRWQMDRLITHIMALSLHIDDFETSTYGLEFDLMLDPSMTSKYYKQLGCSVRKLGKKEAEGGDLVGLHPNAPDRKVAELKTPVEMPKLKTRRE